MCHFINRIIGVILIIFSFSFCTHSGQVREYYPNGKLKRLYDVDKDGIMEGACVEFYDSGDTMGVNYYKDNRLHGKVIRYHANGVISLKGQFRNGIEIGWFEVYNEQEQLIRKIQFAIKNDTLGMENQSIVYKSNGTIDANNSRYFELEKNGTSTKEDSISINIKLVVPQDNFIRVGVIVLNLPNDTLKYIDMNNSLEAELCVPTDANQKFSGHILERYLVDDSIFNRRYYFSEKDLYDHSLHNANN